MLFKFRGAKALILSLIMVIGYVNGASIPLSSTEQNPGPHGLRGTGTILIRFAGDNLLGLVETAKVERYQSGKTFVNYLPLSNKMLGESFGVTQSSRVRTVDDFLSILQRNTEWKQPRPTSFWRNFVWAGGIPLALLCGMYKMPYIKDMDANKRAFLAGCAAVVGIGFACKGLWRLYVPSAQTKVQINAQAIEQHNRFIDDKKVLFADVIDRALKNGDYSHADIGQLAIITHSVDMALVEQKVNNLNDNQPSSDILQEVRAAYLQAQAPAHRAYAAGGLIGLGSSLCVVHQLGGFGMLHQLLKK